MPTFTPETRIEAAFVWLIREISALQIYVEVGFKVEGAYSSRDFESRVKENTERLNKFLGVPPSEGKS